VLAGVIPHRADADKKQGIHSKMLKD
jgi:hypothetical protein